MEGMGVATLREFWECSDHSWGGRLETRLEDALSYMKFPTVSPTRPEEELSFTFAFAITINHTFESHRKPLFTAARWVVQHPKCWGNQYEISGLRELGSRKT